MILKICILEYVQSFKKCLLEKDLKMQLLLVAHLHSHLAVYDEFECKFTYFYVHLFYGSKQYCLILCFSCSF